MTKRAEEKVLSREDFLRLQLPPEFWGASCKQLPGSVKDPIMNFMKLMLVMKESGAGLLIMGAAGTGKTTVAALVLKRSRELGLTGLFTSVAGLREDLRARREYDGDKTMLVRCREVDVLVLDDLSIADARDTMWFGVRHVEELIAARRAARLVTVITTRLSKDAMRADPSLTSMLATAMGALVDIQVIGRNHQETKAAELRALIGARDVKA